MSAIERFHIRTPDSQLEDLRRRLGATRWPDRETVDDRLHQPPRAWAERRHRNLVYWNELPKGGHFAAFEQPAVFVEELRRFLRVLQQA